MLLLWEKRVVPAYYSSTCGGRPANAADATMPGDGSVAKRDAARPTIDRLMAWSPSFYGDLGNVRQRSLAHTQVILPTDQPIAVTLTPKRGCKVVIRKNGSGQGQVSPPDGSFTCSGLM